MRVWFQVAERFTQCPAGDKGKPSDVTSKPGEEKPEPVRDLAMSDVAGIGFIKGAEGPILTARRGTVTEKYRKGEPTATQSPDADKAKISDLGK